ncbi:MAG: VOC family protein [Allomuricauda sp.]
MKHFLLFPALFFVINAFAQKQKIELGNMKINHHVNDTVKIRKFYKDVLGAKLITPKSKVPRDYMEFSNGFRLNIIYLDKGVPNQGEFFDGLWIRIHVQDFKEVAQRIRDSEAKIIKDYPDKNEIYFQAPGGQVFRMGEQKSN